MSRPDNPRFPHLCVIRRYENVSPMEDEVFADDPMADEDLAEGTQGDMTGKPSNANSVVIYEGKCRAYDKHTTSDKGEVITSYRGLALPYAREDWKMLGVVPQEGDVIEVDRGGYTEYGKVIDKNPSNFGGTHLIWRYGRN